MSKIKKSKVKLNLKAFTIEEKIVFARQLVRSLTDNDAFPNPVPALDVVSSIISTTENRHVELETARRQIAALSSVLDDQVFELDGVLNQLAAYVENIAKGDATIIKQAGLNVKAQSSPIGSLQPAINLLAVAINEGEIALTWDVVRGARSYIVQQATDIVAGDWSLALVSTKSKANVTGLTSGKKYWFRVAAVGAAGQGPWSDPATKYAI